MKVSKGLKNRDLLKKHKKQCKKQGELAGFIAAGIKELGKRLGIKKGPGENIPSGQCGVVKTLNTTRVITKQGLALCIQVVYSMISA